jgi:hypothetical protein
MSKELYSILDTTDQDNGSTALLDVSVIEELRTVFHEIRESSCGDCALLEALGTTSLEKAIEYATVYYGSLNSIDDNLMKVSVGVTEEGLALNVTPMPEDDMPEVRKQRSELLEEMNTSATMAIDALRRHYQHCQGPIVNHNRRGNVVYRSQICTSPALNDMPADAYYPAVANASIVHED